MSQLVNELVRVFRDLGAFREGDFVLSSGRESDYYVDGKLVTLNPEGASIVGDVLLETLERYEIDAVGGPEVGAIPVATAVAVRSAGSHRALPAFFVRKKPKQHGLRKWIEGPVQPGMRVAIVDDVVTTGDSVLEAVEHAQEEGLKVVVVVGLVDRQSGATDKFAQAGVRYEFILTPDQLRERVEVAKTA